ncbi:MAG: toll/interleukin-1 receptor domain-containing protein [Bacteroides sp.]|nr:toll/interleukin-1 receptor domain-containing protein [Bacteroides sp.]MCM1548849.1 toll/interleukin-1 receptor domain-containing protein [Clostridium sp.]
MKDFFISYNKADGQWAKWVAGTLEEYGYTTIIQAWDFKPGNNFVLEMQNAILSCARTILILSQSYLDSEYCQAEWASIFNCDPTGERTEIIPIRVTDVKPKGLLSSIIYIDLFGQDEEASIKKLLNGVGYTNNPRKKVKFPLSKNDSNFDKETENSTEVQFIFDLEEDNKINEISILTKNKLREWYYSTYKSNFNVIINDKRQIPIKNHLDKINTKMQQQDLAIGDEVAYHTYMRELRNYEKESLLKQKAIDFFLKDEGLQIYLGITTYLELLDMAKKILNYDYYDQKKYNDSKYVTLDVFLDPAPEECHDHFSACIETELIDEHIGGHSVYDLFGLYIIDLDNSIVKDIAIRFYFFLSDEIITHDNVQLIQNKRILDLLSYSVGLH